jgi:hypothetical protein
VFALMSILTADPAMARKAKGGLSPGNHSAPAAQAAAQPAPVSPEGIKPIPNPRRHGAKGRGISR